MSTQLEQKIKILRADNGREYTSGEFATNLKEKGIVHKFSFPYTYPRKKRSS